MSNNSDLRFSIAGPDLDAFVRVIGLDDYFPARAFELRGDFDGIPVGFEVRNLNARIGDNDLSGNVVVDLRVKPSVSGNFQSAYLDLSERLNQ
ncbi:MAG: hypothetical protein GTO71_11325, partial [Woeseiaceae bacterium]|nr:hypothetical protein [Woeseiaceae bacterium]NIP21658.1 hypothetical protein [Woeseiaceae bacterium]